MAPKACYFASDNLVEELVFSTHVQFLSPLTFAMSVFADPIFSFSPLAIHTRNLLADPRCTLVVQVGAFSHSYIYDVCDVICGFHGQFV